MGGGGGICSLTLRLSLGWHLAAALMLSWQLTDACPVRDCDDSSYPTSMLGLQGSGAE